MKLDKFIVCKIIACVFILSFTSTASLANISSNISSSAEQTTTELFAQSEGSYKILDVPYEDMLYDVLYGDAGACLSMLSGYYGEKVTKQEINAVVDADYIGNTGISMDGFIDAATRDNYSTRDFGYYVELVSLEGETIENCWSFIKGYIDQEIPLIIISKLYPGYPTHHRVIIGYDERVDVLYIHDPWTIDKSPIYQGPKSPMSIALGSWMEDQWANNQYQLAIVRPINISLSIDSGPITTAGNFTLRCSIDTSFMTGLRDLRVKITLPDGYSVVRGSTTHDYFSFKGSASFTCEIACPTPLVNDSITATIRTRNEEIVFGGSDSIYPLHPISIFTNISSNFVDDFAPYKANITAEVNCSGDISPTLHCFSLKPNGSGDGTNTTYSEVEYLSPTTFTCQTGPNEPTTLALCWFKIQTIYGEILSPITILNIYTTDLDDDGISDFDEEVIYFTDPLNSDSDFDDLTDFEEVFTYETNPNNPDSDGDGMNDFDEIAQGFDPLDPTSNLARRNLILILSIGIPVLILLPIPIFFIIRKKRRK